MDPVIHNMNLKAFQQQFTTAACNTTNTTATNTTTTSSNTNTNSCNSGEDQFKETTPDAQDSKSVTSVDSGENC